MLSAWPADLPVTGRLALLGRVTPSAPRPPLWKPVSVPAWPRLLIPPEVTRTGVFGPARSLALPSGPLVSLPSLPSAVQRGRMSEVSRERLGVAGQAGAALKGCPNARGGRAVVHLRVGGLSTAPGPSSHRCRASEETAGQEDTPWPPVHSGEGGDAVRTARGRDGGEEHGARGRAGLVKRHSRLSRRSQSPTQSLLVAVPFWSRRGRETPALAAQTAPSEAALAVEVPCVPAGWGP